MKKVIGLLFIIIIIIIITFGGFGCNKPKPANEVDQGLVKLVEEQVDIREKVCDQLAAREQEKIDGNWREATIEKTIARGDISNLKNSKYNGQEVYLVTFVGLGDLRLYVDMQTKQVVGILLRD